jgi:OTU domain-containing protein 3
MFNVIETKKDLKRFKRKLESIGLVVKQVGGDGNCLFRSVADQLDGDQSKQ